MIGIPDFWVYGAYLLCILSAAACAAYGLINWNKGAENELQQLDEEDMWEKGEREIEEKL